MKKSFLLMLLMVALSFSVYSGGQKEKAKPKKVKIEYFLQKPETQDIMTKLIDMFMKENPNISVEMNVVPDSKQVLLTRMASNDMPDVFSTWPNEVEFKLQCKEGYIADLTGQKYLKNVEASVMDTLRYKGKDYSLPISVNTMGVYYNTKLFKELGLTIPKTYAEYINLLKTVKASGKYLPIVNADKDPWTIGYQVVLLSGMEIPKPYLFFDNLASGKTSATDNKYLKRVAEKILELRKYGQDDNLGTGYAQAIDLFATGKAVTFIQGIWTIPSIRKANPNLKFDMFPFPADIEKNTRVIYGVDFALAAAAKGKHLKEANKFIGFFSRTDIAQIYANKDGSPSLIKGVKVHTKEIAKLTKLLNEGRSFEWLNFHWPPGVFDESHKIAQSLVATQDVNAYLKDVDEIFKNK
ncbi:MAG: extracellular solute-binding protein [Spirochaetes bacterium]|nr:extracellular solute-binding protein [Spirochaetota bacterium]